jgi:23S rRNA pseudouridine1911/1915/1917 synthase
VPADQAGQRLDRWLVTQLEDVSRSQLAAWIKAGHVRVDGHTARASLKLQAEQHVELQRPPPPVITPQPQDIDVPLLHVDDQIIVVNKPAGLVVHPGAGRPDGTLVNALLHAVGSLSNIGAPERPGIVHRIDAGTTGVLVVARTDAAHRHLAKQFADHSAHRVYRALCWDHGLADAGTIESAYGRHPGDRRKFTGTAGDRRAVTHFEVDRRAPPCAWVNLRLETGRTHQIRVHFAEAGHPLVGDPMYGRKRRVQRPQSLRRLGLELGLTRQALHAAQLGFQHPDGRMMHFEAPLPVDLVQVGEALEAVQTR